MRLDKFTLKAQEAVLEAQHRAAEFGNQQVEADHLLLALIDQDEGLVKPILQRHGVNLVPFREALVRDIEKFPKVSGGTGEYLSPQLKKVLETAHQEATKLKD